MKLIPVEVELFHADGRTDIQTDMPKLVIAFRDLEPAPGKTEFSVSIVRYKNSRLVGERNPRHSLRDCLHELIINNIAHNVRVLPYYRKTIYCATCITPYCFINQANRVLNVDPIQNHWDTPSSLEVPLQNCKKRLSALSCLPFRHFVSLPARKNSPNATGQIYMKFSNLASNSLKNYK
jgi:hypothetical protein